MEISGLVASEKRYEWLDSSHDTKSYHNMYQNKTSQDTHQLFQELQNDIPYSFLRSYFINLSTCPEGFLTLRSEFAKSLAITCVYGYLLGNQEI